MYNTCDSNKEDISILSNGMQEKVDIYQTFLHGISFGKFGTQKDLAMNARESPS